MTLRRRLLLLLGAVAAFAVIAAAVTVYAVQWHIEGAVRDFEIAMGRTIQVDRLHLALKEQMLHLRDVVEGRRDAVRPYFASRDEFLTKLRQVATFGPEASEGSPWSHILRLARSFEAESDRCLALVDDQKHEGARELLTSRVEAELLPELDSRLLGAKAALDETRNRTTQQLGTTSSKVLGLTVTVGVFAAVLVIVGAMLIRRWLLAPVAELRNAARRFGEGDLSFRTSIKYEDELGRLGIALNEMAQSVANAQAEAQASEAKHRTLFANLRDAVVICDADGRIVEYHDGETRILGVEAGEHKGRNVLEVWPEWRSAAADWMTIIRTAVADGKRYRAVDVELKPEAGGDTASYVDLQVYRIEYSGARHAAIVLRDVTERQRLQNRLRRAETMEAVGTMAGGLTHDLNNLLTSVVGTLSSLASEFAASPKAEHIRSALRACRTAVGLAKRLLSFADSTEGTPQAFGLADTIETIIDSLDPSFLDGIEVEKQLDHSVQTKMDPDQFTQVAMNLLRNARDAMQKDGRLQISVSSTTAENPDIRAGRQPYALLVVQDSGSGMTPDVQKRAFDPFFTTKSRADRRGRGLGLAIVYSAVNNTGGFVQVESQPDKGTTFRVYLPTAERVTENGVSGSPSIQAQE